VFFGGKMPTGGNEKRKNFEKKLNRGKREKNLSLQLK
jgi:hypothetical protein